MASPKKYLEVKVVNNTGLEASGVYVFVNSQTQIYKIKNVAQPHEEPFWVAEVTGFTDGPAPSVTLTSLPKKGEAFCFYIDAEQDLTSGRVYFSDSDKAVEIKGTSINGPSANAPFNYDFIELTLTASQSINLDTTQIDQFGMPIYLQVQPKDPNFPGGTGIVASSNQTAVINNFKTLCTYDAFKPYQDCFQQISANPPVTPNNVERLIAPQHVIGQAMPQTQLSGDISGAQQEQGGSYSAVFTATGNWSGKLTPPPSISGLKVGDVVGGQNIPPGATVEAVNTDSVTLSSKVGVFVNGTGLDVAFYPQPGTTLCESFDEAIYAFFNYYKKKTSDGHQLYLVSNGTNAGMEIYRGEVITDYTLPEGITDINGNTGTQYTVFQFKGTGYKYDSTTNKLVKSNKPAPGQSNVYQIFYPYFSTNCSASPHNNALTPNGPPAPPEWWQPGWGQSVPAAQGGPLGNLNFVAPASQMVFACDGVFADSAYQNYAFYKAYKKGHGAELQDVSVLGNLENQLVTMFNRGISPDMVSGSNLHMRIGYIAESDFNPIDRANLKQYTAQNPHKPSSIDGAQTKFNLTSPFVHGKASGIVGQSISGTVYATKTEKQTFTINDDDKFIFTPCQPSWTNYAKSGVINRDPKSGHVTSITINWFNAVDIDAVTASVNFKYGELLGDHYARLHFLDPYYKGSPITINAGDLGPASDFCNDLAKGMQMTTMSDFSQPMEVYYLNSDDQTAIIYSPIAFNTKEGAFNTGVLNFADFYPLDGETPKVTWNAYAYYFHNGVFEQFVPTVDGRGYAFSFDDNGGYSSDIDTPLNMQANPVASLTVDLISWSLCTIQADVKWQKTGTYVASGKAVTVTYESGLWTDNPENHDMVNAAGDPQYIAKPGYTLPGQNEGALVGRVGDNLPFLVGLSATTPCGQDGELELCINDDLNGEYGAGFSDNEGAITVKVETET